MAQKKFVLRPLKHQVELTDEVLRIGEELEVARSQFDAPALRLGIEGGSYVLDFPTRVGMARQEELETGR